MGFLTKDEYIYEHSMKSVRKILSFLLCLAVLLEKLTYVDLNYNNIIYYSELTELYYLF